MELWIRSQDKNNLIKVYDIWIDDTDMVDKGYISIMANSDFSFELGIYKTKERALEVLDEIQRLIEDLQYINYAIPNDKFTGYRPNVYEMPEE